MNKRAIFPNIIDGNNPANVDRSTELKITILRVKIIGIK